MKIECPICRSPVFSERVTQAVQQELVDHQEMIFLQNEKKFCTDLFTKMKVEERKWIRLFREMRKRLNVTTGDHIASHQISKVTKTLRSDHQTIRQSISTYLTQELLVERLQQDFIRRTMINIDRSEISLFEK